MFAVFLVMERQKTRFAAINNKITVKQNAVQNIFCVYSETSLS
jgi:hypothetical protein